MAMEKKTIVVFAVAITLLILLAFAFLGIGLPCGNWGTSIDPGAKYKDCTCIGLKLTEGATGGGSISCLGIPGEYSCYYNSAPGRKASISCD